MADADNKVMFEFLVLSSWLEKAEERGLVVDLLTEVRDRFFSDPDQVESSVPFQDVHGKVARVFTGLEKVLKPVNGVVVSGELEELKHELLNLRDDPVIKEELDTLYRVFLKEVAQTASRRIQSCILSIL